MRRLTALALLLAAAWPATALAQAGDEQYSDPLATPTSTTQSQTQTQPTLSQTPVGSSPSGTTRPHTSTRRPSQPATSATGAPQAAAGLPNTGADARVLALLGVALLLAGIGLRLRTADERF